MNKMLLMSAMFAAGLGSLAVASAPAEIRVLGDDPVPPLPKEAIQVKPKRLGNREAIVRLNDIRPETRPRSASLDRLLRMKARA